MTEEKPLSGYAIVEILGHRVYAGQISEHVIGSAAMIRIDVPAIEGQHAFTKLFGVGSIYAVTPCTEEAAREALKRHRPRPLQELGIYPDSPSNQKSLDYDPIFDVIDEEDEEDDDES